MNSKVLGLLFGVSLVGCGMSVEQGVRTRAAFDLGCPADKVNIASLGSDAMQARYTYGVDGCGKRSTYICQRNAFGDPTCVKNAETARD
jgi:hypothetical protein